MKRTDFKNKVVVITGAASGIGAAFVRYFASRGAKIVLLDMQEDNMIALAKEIELKKDDHLIFSLDITNQEKVKEVFEVVGKRFEKIDVLINNAGISQISLFKKYKSGNF